MSKSILIIDDQEHVRQNVMLSLNMTDAAQNGIARIIAGGQGASAAPRFVMHEAASGEEGLAVFEKQQSDGSPLDLVIVDMRMGDGIDGMETIRRLRQINHRTPIIIYSGWVDFTLQDIKNLDGDACLEIVSKPRIRDLRQQVDRLLA